MIWTTSECACLLCVRLGHPIRGFRRIPRSTSSNNIIIYGKCLTPVPRTVTVVFSGPEGNPLPQDPMALTTRPRSADPLRPTLDDVQRLSEGRAAKKRGWGSRQIPHRLNAEERKSFELAKRKGVLTIKGSGYRRERKGSPLANIWRQYSDALGRSCIIVEQSGSGKEDMVLLDASTLRDAGEIMSLLHRVKEAAMGLGLGSVSVLKDVTSPFTVIVPEGILNVDAKPEIEASLTEHLLRSPIWQQWPQLIAFSTERNEGKLLSKHLVETFF